jgi:hypothetical protein
MMQDIQGKLNPWLVWQKQLSERRRWRRRRRIKIPLLPENGLKLKEETNKVLHFKSSFMWC